MSVIDDLKADARSKLDQASAIADLATREKRPLTKSETGRVEGLLREVASFNCQAKVARQREALTEQIDQMNSQWMAPYATKGLGDVLLASGLGQGPDGKLDVKASRTVTIPAFPIFGAKAQTIPATADLSPLAPSGIEYLGRDERWMYSAMPTVDLGTDLSVRDFRETVRTPAGTVERDPASTAAKATLGVTVVAVTSPAKQEAVLLDGVPNAVLESVDSFRAFADAELKFQIQRAIDLHCYTNVNTGATFATVGTTMIEKLRNGVTGMQSDGFTPDLAVLNPSDASALDLSADAGGFVFPVRDTGTSSPLWSMRIVTRTGTAEPPLLVDTTRIGQLYMGVLRFDFDPFSGAAGNNFATNRTDIRAEVNVLMHVRSAKAARRIAAT